MTLFTVLVLKVVNTAFCSAGKYTVSVCIALGVSDRSRYTMYETAVAIYISDTTRLWKTNVSVNLGHHKHFATTGMPLG